MKMGRGGGGGEEGVKNNKRHRKLARTHTHAPEFLRAQSVTPSYTRQLRLCVPKYRLRHTNGTPEFIADSPTLGKRDVREGWLSLILSRRSIIHPVGQNMSISTDVKKTPHNPPPFNGRMARAGRARV